MRILFAAVAFATCIFAGPVFAEEPERQIIALLSACAPGSDFLAIKEAWSEGDTEKFNKILDDENTTCYNFKEIFGQAIPGILIGIEETFLGKTGRCGLVARIVIMGEDRKPMEVLSIKEDAEACGQGV